MANKALMAFHLLGLFLHSYLKSRLKFISADKGRYYTQYLISPDLNESSFSTLLPKLIPCGFKTKRGAADTTCVIKPN